MIRESKKIGFKMLKENFKIISLSFALYIIIISLVDMVFNIESDVMKVLFGLVSFILSAILGLGLSGIITKIYYGNYASIKDIFSYFNEKKAFERCIILRVLYSLLLIVFCILICLVFFNSFASLYEALLNYRYNDLFFSTNILDMLLKTLLIPFILIFIFSALLSAVMDFGDMMIIRKNNWNSGFISGAFSVGIKNTFKYFLFQLSFFGWIFLIFAIMIYSFTMISVNGYIGHGSGFQLLLIILSTIGLLFLVLYIQCSTIVYINKILDESYGKPDIFSHDENREDISYEQSKSENNYTASDQYEIVYDTFENEEADKNDKKDGEYVEDINEIKDNDDNTSID